MIVGCVLWVRLDVDDRVRLHRRNQSGPSSRPPGGLPERLDNDGPLLRSLGIGRGVHTLPARHRTQRARPYDDNRLANINQSCWRRSSLSSVAIPSSMAGRLEFLQPQVRPSVRPPHIDRCVCCVSLSPSCALLYTFRPSFDVYRWASRFLLLMFAQHTRKAPPFSPSMHSRNPRLLLLLWVGSTLSKKLLESLSLSLWSCCCFQQWCMPFGPPLSSHLHNDMATPSSPRLIFF